MIAFPGARAAAIQLMRDENPDDQINSDEDDDEEEDNDANAVVDPPPSSSPGLQHIGKYTVKKWITTDEKYKMMMISQLM